MSAIDYPTLSPVQRVAVLLIVIGPEAAAQVLKNLDDAETEALVRAMTTFDVIPEAVHRLCLHEFGDVFAKGASSVLGGYKFAEETLTMAQGAFKASSVIDRVGGTVQTPSEALAQINEMEPRQVYNLLKAETAQTIACVLSYLEKSKGAQVFELLSPELRDEVLERVGSIEPTSAPIVNKLAANLARHIDAKARPTFYRSGGVRAVAELLNLLDRDTSKNLLMRLEDRSADLGAAIRKKLFSFEDISRLQTSDLQRVLREVDMMNLATAMKSASPGLKDKLYGALSKRAAEGLKEEMQNLGAVRLKDVEAAQDAIIRSVRQLEEEGQISLDSADSQLVSA